MIKNVFLPERIGNYFPFGQRIIGISINGFYVNVIQLYAKGRSITIEKAMQEKLESNGSIDYNDLVIAALKKIKGHVHPASRWHTVLPSSFVTFKELKLPFYDYEKINMVIRFEIEPLLPFPVEDALIDFVITKHLKNEQGTEIMVAAVQKKHLIEHLNLFEQNGIQTDVVSVDLLSLYGLYQQVPEYMQLAGNVGLLALDKYSTHVGHIYNQQLRAVRTLNKGIFHIAEMANSELKENHPEMIKHFMQYGLSNSHNATITDALKKATTQFISDIYFTLNSFTAQTSSNEIIDNLILCGEETLIPELPMYIGKVIPTTVISFDIHEVLNSCAIIIQHSLRIDNRYLVSLGAALPNTILDNFNLLKAEFAPRSHRVIIKQLSALLLMSILSITLLLTYFIIDIKNINNENLANKEEAISLLKNEFPQEIDENGSLEEAIETAQTALKRKQKTWQPFSGQARISFLTYWLELTNLIDKETLGFVIDSLKMTPQALFIKGKVKDYEALKALERELKQSNIFVYNESQTSPVFEMKIVIPSGISNSGGNKHHEVD